MAHPLRWDDVPKELLDLLGPPQKRFGLRPAALAQHPAVDPAADWLAFYASLYRDRREVHDGGPRVAQVAAELRRVLDAAADLISALASTSSEARSVATGGRFPLPEEHDARATLETVSSLSARAACNPATWTHIEALEELETKLGQLSIEVNARLQHLPRGGPGGILDWAHENPKAILALGALRVFAECKVDPDPSVERVALHAKEDSELVCFADALLAWASDGTDTGTLRPWLERLTAQRRGTDQWLDSARKHLEGVTVLGPDQEIGPLTPPEAPKRRRRKSVRRRTQPERP